MSAEFNRLIEVIAQLREHCPWMATLNHESLIKYLIEESYELVEAIEESHPVDELRDELGDVLLQVVLHARLAEEVGDFSISEVVRALTEKMVRRNQHVFDPDGSLRSEFPATVPEIITSWYQAKAREKPERSRFEGLPSALPALSLAQKSLQRGSRLDDSGAAGIAVPQEVVQPAETGSDKIASAEIELGDRLLELLRSVPELDAERALRLAVRRFQQGVNDAVAGPVAE